MVLSGRRNVEGWLKQSHGVWNFRTFFCSSYVPMIPRQELLDLDVSMMQKENKRPKSLLSAVFMLLEI